MKLHSIILAGLICASTSSIASAAAWEVTDDKGLQIHRLTVDSLRLTLTCDPEGLYSPPQNFALVDHLSQRVETGTLTVTSGEQAISLTIDGGSILPSHNTEAWNEGVAILLGSAPYTVQVGDVSASVTVEGNPRNVCATR